MEPAETPDRKGKASMDFSSYSYNKESSEKPKPARTPIRQFIKQKRRTGTPLSSGGGGSMDPVIVVSKRDSQVESPDIFGRDKEEIEVKQSPNRPSLSSLPDLDEIKTPTKPKPKKTSVRTKPTPKPVKPKEPVKEEKYVEEEEDLSDSSEEDLSLLSLSEFPDTPSAYGNVDIYTPKKPSRLRNTPMKQVPTYSPQPILVSPSSPSSLQHLAPPAVLTLSPQPLSNSNSQFLMTPEPIPSTPKKKETKIASKKLKKNPITKESNSDTDKLMKMFKEQQEQIKNLTTTVQSLVDAQKERDHYNETMELTNLNIPRNESKKKQIHEQDENDEFKNREGIEDEEWISILQEIMDENCNVEEIFPNVIENGTIEQCIQLLENYQGSLEMLPLTIFHQVFDVVSYILDNNIESGKYCIFLYYYNYILILFY